MSKHNSSADNYHHVLSEMKTHSKKHAVDMPNLVCVSKTYDADAIQPVIDAGARVFGENRVQEAQGKWPVLKSATPDIELHLIGPLQSNKTKEAVALFDCIQTVDREKIAKALAKELKAQEKPMKFFIQVNTGSEPQKAGILPDEALSFVNYCQNDLGLEIEGLMCIPPFDENPGPHFALLRKLSREACVKKLSMGMSVDYLTAIEFNATHVRVGSGIFGVRDYSNG